jgi:elongation factor 2 kinase
MAASTVSEKVYNDDFDKLDRAEQAIKHQYDPRTREWARSLINVVVEPQSFAEGSLRTAYRMTDLSVTGNDSRYVLKMSKDLHEQTDAYFVDVQMQMEAKMYAELFNADRPPKTVDFLDAYVLELKDRPGKPICAVEKCKPLLRVLFLFFVLYLLSSRFFPPWHQG